MKLIMSKRCLWVLIMVLSMNFGNVFAHEDFYTSNSFGNIKTSILTGYQYEEINKVAIFGQLAEILSKELNYSDRILLDNTFGSGSHKLADNPKISPRQVIENTSAYFLWYPFQIESIGGDKVSITLWSSSWDREYRTLLFLADEDRLIQDLDKLLNKGDETDNKTNIETETKTDNNTKEPMNSKPPNSPPSRAKSDKIAV